MRVLPAPHCCVDVQADEQATRSMRNKVSKSGRGATL